MRDLTHEETSLVGGGTYQAMDGQYWKDSNQCTTFYGLGGLMGGAGLGMVGGAAGMMAGAFCGFIGGVWLGSGRCEAIPREAMSKN